MQEEVQTLKLSKNKNSLTNKNSSTVRKRKRIDQYCWTHGACAHQSKDCEPTYRKNGHVEDATFTNKQVGSTLYCEWNIGIEDKTTKQEFKNLVYRLSSISQHTTIFMEMQL